MIPDFDSGQFDALKSVPREFPPTGQGRGFNWR